MTKYPSSDTDASPERNEYDLQDDETDLSGLLKGSLSFPGAQYFDGIMHEKIQPKKIAKFRVPRKTERDS